MTALPFNWIPHRRRLAAFIVASAVAAVLLIALTVLDRPLRTAAAPEGIVSFELAGDLTVALRILDSWSPATRISAGLSLGLDYLFLVVYAAAIAMACGMAASRLAPRWKCLYHLGAFLAWGQFIAAGCDAVENFLLAKLLLGAAEPTLPGVARVCALVKFAIIGAGLLYAAAVGGFTALLRRRVPEHQTGETP